MLLRIPPGHVANKFARERDGTVVVAIGAPKRAKQIAPLSQLMQLVRVIECVSGLMTHVHHDLARVFQIVHVAFKPRQVRVGQIERNADDRLARRAAPLIGEITKRTELVDALRFQLAIKLLHESFQRRTLEFEPEFTNGLGEYLLEFSSGFFEIAHGYSEFYTTDPDLAQPRVSPMQLALRARLQTKRAPTMSTQPSHLRVLS